MSSEERSNAAAGATEESAGECSKQTMHANCEQDAGSLPLGSGNDVDAPDRTHDELAHMVLELGFQNDYLNAEIRNAKHGSAALPVALEEDSGDARDCGGSEQVKCLQEEIMRLRNELQEQKQTQKAAEEALEHLRTEHSDAHTKAHELSVKLAEAQQKMELEIKERDEKYVDLDTKFGRLHKRAKQRIQDLQKEKDDIEAKYREVTALAEKTSNQQTLAQKEMDKTRQQANEALRSMDSERQQLRAANSRLRDNMEELHRLLEARDNTLAELRQSCLDKEQMLEETRSLLRSLDEKRQNTIVEISGKHQTQVESLEAQLAEELSQRSKAAETISSLQTLVDEKDSKITELEAASSGEAARLGAALDEAKAELFQLKDQHEKDLEIRDATCRALSVKVETSESAYLSSEIEAAKIRSQLGVEISALSQSLSMKDVQISVSKEEIRRLESEFSAYKARAYALLQKKDAELSAAMNSKVQEEATKEIENELAIALAERDKALQNLQDALNNHDREITTRDEALDKAEQKIKSMVVKLDVSSAHYLSEKEAWHKNLEIVEDNWKIRYAALEAPYNNNAREIQKSLEDFKIRYSMLKEEHGAFRDIADRTIEEKDLEIAKLKEENGNLRHSLESRPLVDHNDKQNFAARNQGAHNLSVAAAEQQILLLAKQQAQREEEVAQSQRQILALQEEIEELERENRLHNQQETMLKSELRNMERSQKRDGVDMTYLKNVILKLLETGEVEALLPVVGTLLQFSPEEIQKCQQAYRPTTVELPSPEPVDKEATPPRSLFSRFSFT